MSSSLLQSCLVRLRLPHSERNFNSRCVTEVLSGVERVKRVGTMEAAPPLARDKKKRRTKERQSVKQVPADDSKLSILVRALLFTPAP
jgi:hypothetical protein